MRQIQIDFCRLDGRGRKKKQLTSAKVFRERVYYCKLVLDDVDDEGDEGEQDKIPNRHGDANTKNMVKYVWNN